MGYKTKSGITSKNVLSCLRKETLAKATTSHEFKLGSQIWTNEIFGFFLQYSFWQSTLLDKLVLGYNVAHVGRRR